MRNSKLASEIPPWKSVKYLLEASPPRQRYYLIIAIGFESISGAPIRKNGRLQKTRERFQIVTHPSPQFHNLVPASAPLPPLHDIEKIFHRPGSFEYFNLFRHFYRSIQEIVQAKEYECLFLKKKKLLPPFHYNFLTTRSIITETFLILLSYPSTFSNFLSLRRWSRNDNPAIFQDRLKREIATVPHEYSNILCYRCTGSPVIDLFTRTHR